MNVLNFDSQKVRIEKGVVKKRTSLLEYQQFCMARDYLWVSPIVLDCGISVRTASLIDWVDSDLITEFCLGLNLEHAFIQRVDKLFCMKVIRELLWMFRERGFLWGDMAPRNMVLDKKSDIIYIFDFERKLVIKDNLLEEKIFNRFFRNYAYEEFSCVLFPYDQEILFAELLAVDSVEKIPSSEIQSKRKKRLLEHLIGQREEYFVREVCLAEDLMSAVATPFMVGDGVVYPMFLIEKIVKKGGSYAYAKTVKALEKCSNGAEKLAVLEATIRRFFSDGRERI